MEYATTNEMAEKWRITSTIEECKSLLRAKQLRDIGLQILQEESNGTTKEWQCTD